MRKRKIKNLKRKKKLAVFNTTKSFVKKPWIKRLFKHSAYPYLLVVSCFRRNIFLNVTNYKGQTKHWTNSGSFSFKGKTKKEHMALVTVTYNFFKRISSLGIRQLMVIFKNYSFRHRAIIQGIKLALSEYYFMKFLSVTLKIHNVFNGCRSKKERRKKHHLKKWSQSKFN